MSVYIKIFVQFSVYDPILFIKQILLKFLEQSEFFARRMFGTILKCSIIVMQFVTHISVAQGKIKSCKEKIDRCKTSLQCQREDLKRLYLDSVTNGQILDLLARMLVTLDT